VEAYEFDPGKSSSRRYAREVGASVHKRLIRTFHDIQKLVVCNIDNVEALIENANNTGLGMYLTLPAPTPALSASVIISAATSI
jgi:hypothetical protein